MSRRRARRKTRSPAGCQVRRRRAVTKFMNTLMERRQEVGRRAHRLRRLRQHRRASSSDDPLTVFHEGARQREAGRRGAARAASAAPPTRCRSKCDPSAARRSAIRWLIQAARDRSATARRCTRSSSAELLDASNHRGNAVKKREDTHKMADANKAFAHYRW